MVINGQPHRFTAMPVWTQRNRFKWMVTVVRREVPQTRSHLGLWPCLLFPNVKKIVTFTCECFVKKAIKNKKNYPAYICLIFLPHILSITGGWNQSFFYSFVHFFICSVNIYQLPTMLLSPGVRRSGGVSPGLLFTSLTGRASLPPSSHP